MPTYRISLDSITRVQRFDYEPTFEVDVKGVEQVRIEMLKDRRAIGKQCIDFLSAVNAWKIMMARTIVGDAVEAMDGCTYIEADRRVRCAGVFGDPIYDYRVEVTSTEGDSFERTVEMAVGVTFLDVLAAVTERDDKCKYFKSGGGERISFKYIGSVKVTARASETSRCGVQAGMYLQRLAQITVTKERAICLAVEILESCSQADAVEILRDRGFEVQNES